MVGLFGAICAQTRQETSKRFLRLLPTLWLLLGLLLAAMPLLGQQKVEKLNDGSVITTRADGSRHLVLSNAVTSIKEWVFAWKQLTLVTIPPSVKTIGDEAFSHNPLTSVIIPSSVTSIGYKAFRHNQLEEVILPAALYSNRGTAFSRNPVGLKFYNYNTKRPGSKGRYLGTN